MGKNACQTIQICNESYMWSCILVTSGPKARSEPFTGLHTLAAFAKWRKYCSAGTLQHRTPPSVLNMTGFARGKRLLKLDTYLVETQTQLWDVLRIHLLPRKSCWRRPAESSMSAESKQQSGDKLAIYFGVHFSIFRVTAHLSLSCFHSKCFFPPDYKVLHQWGRGVGEDVAPAVSLFPHPP